jgi:hypothetical protein
MSLFFGLVDSRHTMRASKFAVVIAANAAMHAIRRNRRTYSPTRSHSSCRSDHIRVRGRIVKRDFARAFHVKCSSMSTGRPRKTIFGELCQDGARRRIARGARGTEFGAQRSCATLLARKSGNGNKMICAPQCTSMHHIPGVVRGEVGCFHAGYERQRGPGFLGFRIIAKMVRLGASWCIRADLSHGERDAGDTTAFIFA